MELDPFNIYQKSRQDFSRAYSKQFWRSIFSWVRNKNNELLPFEEVRKNLPMTGQNEAGLHQIEIDKIIGSVGRYHDFDRAFLPKQTHTRERWENIDRTYFKNIILPPIDVYKIGDAYFVKDGNHRVSVARERGQIYMDAYVTEIHTPARINSHTDINQLLDEHEYSNFMMETGVDKVLPDQDFRFSIPGQYTKVLQHISVHRWFMGEKAGREVTNEEAVLGWYSEIYSPLIRVIRKYNILKEFPDRTEMDLYLWIIEHRWFLAEEQHRNISMESAALHFARQFSERPIRHIRQIWKWFKKKMITWLKGKQR